MKFEEILLKIFSEYGIIGVVLMIMLYINILRLKSDLADRKANREYLKVLMETVNETKVEVKAHSVKIKNLEKTIFK